MPVQFNCSNPLCRMLDESTRKILCNAKIRFKLEPKQEGLFNIGEGQLILLDKGQIITVRQRRDGKQKGIEVLRSGDILGASQLFGKVRPVTILISAKEQVQGCIFMAEFLEDVCQHHPNFACAVIHNMSRRFSEAINQIEHISLDDSTEKILFTLDKVNGSNKSFLFTHEDLALLAGLNRVTATKAIQKIREKMTSKIELSTEERT